MKKTMKWFAALAAMILILAAAGCTGKPEQTTEAAKAETTTEATTEAATETATEAATEATTEATTEETTEEPTTEETTEALPDTAITLVDMMGHEVTLLKPAERIVALSAADCEIVYALGAGDLLVGRGEYCDYPAEVFDVPSVESGGNTNIEQILALEPDVVVMSSMAQNEDQVKQLEDAGVACVVSNAADIEGTYTSIRLLGALLGKDAEAESVVSYMQETFEEIAANKLDGTKTIYFEVSPLEWGLWTAGKGTFMNEIAEMMGLKNCFDDVDQWAEISEEQVLERNPDYIMTITMYWGEGPTPEEEIMGRAGWENVTAVKNGAILNLQNNELSRPAPRLAEGARMLYDFIIENEATVEAMEPAA